MPRKNPSTRWFFKDWHEDEALQMCSLQARGAWIEMLCLCAENDGYLLIGGKHPSLAGLARYLRASRQLIRPILTELENQKVFSRTSEGVIFNRRMVRAHDSEQEATKKPGSTTDSNHPSRAQRTPTHTRNTRPRARPPAPNAPTSAAHRKLPRSIESLSSSSFEIAARAPEGLNGVALRAHDSENDSDRWKQLNVVLSAWPELAQPEPSPVQRHMQWLQQHDPGSLELYLAAAMSDNPDDARRMFELVQQRIDADG